MAEPNHTPILTLNGNNAATDKNSPSADTLPKTHVNALKMLEDGVFDEGYDSDGYIGPPRGTDAAELEALEKRQCSTIHHQSFQLRRKKRMTQQ
jgi:hypothetical protein